MKDPYLLIKYAEGTATDAERKQVESWLEASPVNKETLEQYIQIWKHSGELEGLDQLNIEADLAQVKARAGIAQKRTMVQPIRIWRMAAVILLLIGISVIWLYFNQTGNPDLLLAENPPGSQPLKIELSDGTIVSLNAASTLRYPVAFTTNSREVILNGEAFFDITTNPEQAFVIQTDQTEVKVLGTKFNLRAFSSESKNELTVVEGKVIFAEKNNVANQLILTANQQAIFEEANKQLTRKPDLNANAMSWHTGMLTFQNSHIQEVIKDLNRHFSVDIRLPAHMPSEGCFVNSQYENETLDSILEELGLILDMEYSKSGNIVEISTLNCAKSNEEKN